jgi:hypothetical protein
VLALILRALALWTASTFPPSLVWPTILAVALWPLHLQFATRFMAGPLVFAAFVFTMLVALVLFTPISLAVYTIAQQSDLLIDWLKRAGEGGIEVPGRRCVDWRVRRRSCVPRQSSRPLASVADPSRPGRGDLAVEHRLPVPHSVDIGGTERRRSRRGDPLLCGLGSDEPAVVLSYDGDAAIRSSVAPDGRDIHGEPVGGRDNRDCPLAFPFRRRDVDDHHVQPRDRGHVCSSDLAPCSAVAFSSGSRRARTSGVRPGKDRELAYLPSLPKAATLLDVFKVFPETNRPLQVVVSVVGIALLTAVAYYRSWSRKADKRWKPSLTTRSKSDRPVSDDRRSARCTAGRSACCRR